MNAWEEHLEGQKELELMIGGKDGMATLSFPTIPGQSQVPLTHSRLVSDFRLDNGQSNTSFVEKCEFRAELIGHPELIKKGLPVDLQINPRSPKIKMQLWLGGYMPGAYIFRFMLVSADYH